MNQDTTKLWLLAAYRLFAHEGPKGLKIEVLAREVGKSKSPFYHHFADLEVFTELLLRYHLDRARLIAKQEAACQNVVPDLVNVLVEVKQDLLFNRQLRVYRDIPAFRQCFEAASEKVGGAIAQIWADMLGLADDSALAQVVLKLSFENFCLQITEETLTYEWLLRYVQELREMVRALQNRQAAAVVR